MKKTFTFGTIDLTIRTCVYSSVCVAEIETSYLTGRLLDRITYEGQTEQQAFDSALRACRAKFDPSFPREIAVRLANLKWKWVPVFSIFEGNHDLEDYLELAPNQLMVACFEDYQWVTQKCSLHDGVPIGEGYFLPLGFAQDAIRWRQMMQGKAPYEVTWEKFEVVFKDGRNSEYYSYVVKTTLGKEGVVERARRLGQSPLTVTQIDRSENKISEDYVWSWR